MTKLVLFDLDGTLADTLCDIAASVNRGLAANGLPTYPLDAYRHFVGDGMKKLIERAVGDTADKTAAVLDYYRRDYPQNCLVETKPYDGIVGMLRTLISRGIKVAIVTNKPQNQTDVIVPHCFPDISFEAVLGTTPDRPTKPDPTGVFAVLKVTGVDAENALFVGDSDVDVQTAHNAGIRCIGVDWGFRGRAELTAAGADYTVEKAEEILTIVFNNAR